nr:E7 [Erethizon dorsatum papillomavirus 1]
MMGKKVDIKDIVLEKVTTESDCANEEEEELGLQEEPQEQQVQLAPCDIYVIETLCFGCSHRLVFACGSSQGGIRQLQELLVGDLELLCNTCSTRHGYTRNQRDRRQR